jgi:hypothetical protein
VETFEVSRGRIKTNLVLIFDQSLHNFVVLELRRDTDSFPAWVTLSIVKLN